MEFWLSLARNWEDSVGNFQTRCDNFMDRHKSHNNRRLVEDLLEATDGGAKHSTKNTFPSFSLGFFSNKCCKPRRLTWRKISKWYFYHRETLQKEMESDCVGWLLLSGYKRSPRLQSRRNQAKKTSNLLQINGYFTFLLQNVILNKSWSKFMLVIFSFLCLTLLWIKQRNIYYYVFYIRFLKLK